MTNDREVLQEHGDEVEHRINYLVGVGKNRNDKDRWRQ